jgi:hypothetical protein
MRRRECDLPYPRKKADNSLELKFGAGIVTMILPWIAGPKQAKEIIFMGRRVAPVQARP